MLDEHAAVLKSEPVGIGAKSYDGSLITNHIFTWYITWPDLASPINQGSVGCFSSVVSLSLSVYLSNHKQ